jgi:peptidoglycan/xylan/chitin deacetylase (PgdA/CDA1 family)
VRNSALHWVVWSWGISRAAEAMDFLQSFALHLIRAAGGFSLARYLTRRRLRILCYHGFSVGDEFKVLPMMFMRAETFDRRMRILKRRRLPVIPLDTAVRRLQSDAIVDADTVITLDDGWASNLTIGVPILEKHGYPACIYLTTEHLGAGTEAFNVALYYIIRKSSRTTLTLSDIHPDIDGVYDIGIDPDAVVARLIGAAEKAFPLVKRQELLRPIAAALDVDLGEVFRNGRFAFLSASEIRELARRGIDIELHTHTHRLPHDQFEAMCTEISRNRSALQALTGSETRHFCYPSGLYDARHPEWLQRLGIASATTCDPGLNTSRTSPMLLRRYLDSEVTSEIVFEAEICGVRDLVRDMRSTMRRLLERVARV